jgi:hypothetical protein
MDLIPETVRIVMAELEARNFADPLAAGLRRP